MLTHKNCSPEQEEKILKRLKVVWGLRVQGWDSDDDVGFGECYTLQGNWVQWQIRSGRPCCIGFRHGDFEYNPESPEVMAKVQELTDKILRRYRTEL